MDAEGRAPPIVRRGRLVRLGLVITTPDPNERDRWAAMAERVGIEVLWLRGGEPAPRTGLPALALPDVDEPWARTVSVVVGRSGAEAAALVGLAAGFGGYGDPRVGGLFGTLDECQTQVARLASEGVRELRCVLPELPDVHDLLAQLPALVVGRPATHHPDAPRSADPAPPPWAARRER